MMTIKTMECSVCYENGPCRRLCCGHEFCSGCIKSWYLKGTGSGCPMCRRPIYFRGFKKVQGEWDEDAWHTRCSDAFETSVENVIENMEATQALWPKEFHPFFRRQAMRHMLMSERMIRCLKECCYSSEDIDFLLNETDLYFSRSKPNYADEPMRDKVPYKVKRAYRKNGPFNME